MFQLIAFLVALIAGLYKLWEKEGVTWGYFFLSIIISGIVSLIIAIFGGFLFPAEAIKVATSAELITVLLAHFFSAFIGAVIIPVVQVIAKIKLA